jgi:hypothetical protein
LSFILVSSHYEKNPALGGVFFKFVPSLLSDRRKTPCGAFCPWTKSVVFVH